MRPFAASVMLAVALAGCGEPEAERPVVPAVSGPLLFLAGDGELWRVDVAAQVARRFALPELVPGDPPFKIVRRGDRLVLWGYTTYSLDPRAEVPRPEPVARDGWIFVPGAREDRLWVGFLAPGQPATSVRLHTLRELDAHGRVTAPDVAPPDGRWPTGAVEAGLVFDQPGGAEVWDPATRAVVRRLPAGELAGPAAGNRVLTCADPCVELHVTDASSGERRAIGLPPGVRGFDAWSGAFSPDTERLALGVRRGESFEGPRELAVVDLAGGAVEVIAGSEVPHGYVNAVWSADGGHVFLSGGERFRERVLVAHRLGDATSRRLAVTVGDFYGMAAY